MSDEYKFRMLRSLSQEPRPLMYWTNGAVHATVSIRHIERYAEEMVADGLTFFADGKFHITEVGLEEVNRPTTKAEPRTWCGAATERNWKPKPWNSVRAGADEHKQHQSLMTWGPGA